MDRRRHVCRQSVVWEMMIAQSLGLRLLATGWLAAAPSTWAEPANSGRTFSEHLTDAVAQSVEIAGDRAPVANQLESVVLTVDDWLAQARGETVVITDVQLRSTPEGLTVTLVSEQPLSAGALSKSKHGLRVERAPAVRNARWQLR